MIFSRSQRKDYDPDMTQKIDDMLNKLANNMPEIWWNPLDACSSMKPEEIMERVIHAQMQIIHYNMLTVLHLPHLFRADTLGQHFDYSRETCLYASREVLRQVSSSRSIIRIVYCCRLVDFCAFTAAMTLLLSDLLTPKPTRQTSHQRIGERCVDTEHFRNTG